MHRAAVRVLPLYYMRAAIGSSIFLTTTMSNDNKDFACDAIVAAYTYTNKISCFKKKEDIKCEKIKNCHVWTVMSIILTFIYCNRQVFNPRTGTIFLTVRISQLGNLLK